MRGQGSGQGTLTLVLLDLGGVPQAHPPPLLTETRALNSLVTCSHAGSPQVLCFSSFLKHTCECYRGGKRG